MSVSLGQDLSSVVGMTGLFTGDPNSAGGSLLMSSLGKGFTAESPQTPRGEFNGSAQGLTVPKIAEALPGIAPASKRELGL